MHYKFKVKSLISLLLSVLLVMTLLPATVWAATYNVTDEAGLRTAILNAKDGDIISIDDDITLTETPYTLVINEDITLTSADGCTLDLGGNNGSKIQISSIAEVTLNGDLKVTGSDTYVVHVFGTLTLAGDASIEQTKSGEVYAVYNNGGTVNITGGNIQSTHTGIDNYAGELTVNDGEISGSKYGIRVMGSSGLADISGGSIRGSHAVSVGTGATTPLL